MVDELLLQLIIAVLALGIVGCTGVMYVMYARIKQLVAELRVIKSRVEITDEELSKLTDDIAEFKMLKF
jgi:cell division protein FtsB